MSAEISPPQLSIYEHTWLTSSYTEGDARNAQSLRREVGGSEQAHGVFTCFTWGTKCFAVSCQRQKYYYKV